jgi:hypothetical protein
MAGADEHVVEDIAQDWPSIVATSDSNAKKGGGTGAGRLGGLGLGDSDDGSDDLDWLAGSRCGATADDSAPIAGDSLHDADGGDGMPQDEDVGDPKEGEGDAHHWLEQEMQAMVGELGAAADEFAEVQNQFGST